MTPALLQSTQPPGLPAFTWLNRLKASTRNCAFSLSGITLNALMADASVCFQRGPGREFRTSLPKVPICGLRQGPLVSPLLSKGDAIWYQFARERLDTPAPPRRSGWQLPTSLSEPH
jgi:hypothetical protein